MIIVCCCPKSFFELFNDLIGHIVWPSLILILVFMFKGALIELLGRIRSIEGGGIKAKFQEELEELGKDTKIASEQGTLDTEVSKKEEARNETENIIQVFSNDPIAGIIRLSIEIENELRKIIAAKNLYSFAEKRPIRFSIELLYQKKYFEPETRDSLLRFWDVRNSVIHSTLQFSKNQLKSFFDIGLTLLNTIKSIPHVKQKVYKANIPLYYDSTCTNQIQEVTGIIIKAEDSEGVQRTPVILPTRIKDYIEGKELAWRVTFQHTWGETWYKHPDTGNITLAWSSAGEFEGVQIP